MISPLFSIGYSEDNKMKEWLLPLLISALLGACATSGELEQTRRQLENIKNQTQMKLNDLDSRISSDKLIDLLNQVETMKAHVNALRGEVDELKVSLESMQKRQNELYDDLDKRLENRQVSNHFSSSNDTNTSEDSYEKGISLMKQRKFDVALDSLENFVNSNPNDNRVADARFWIGVAYTGLNECSSAIDVHRKFVTAYPNNNNIPEAMLNIARCLRTEGRQDEAKQAVQSLQTKFPKSKAAQKAREQLADL